MNFSILIFYNVFYMVSKSLLVHGYSDGAPTDACYSDGMPGHDGIERQPLETSSCTISASDFVYTNGTEITVTIEGKQCFKGFFIRAIKGETGEPIGYFKSSDEGIAIDECSAITHTNATKKFCTKLTWKYEGISKGKVYFNSTIVYAYDNFCVGLVTQNEEE